MSTANIARFLIEVIKHPLTQKLAQHAIRLGSAALIRHLREHVRAK